MAKIKFENGLTVNFEGTPTQQDIDEVWESVKDQQPMPKTAPKERTFDWKKGLQGLKEKIINPISAGTMGAIGGTYEAAGNMANVLGKLSAYNPLSPELGRKMVLGDKYQSSGERFGSSIQAEARQANDFIKGQIPEAFGEHKIAQGAGEIAGSMLPSIAVGGALSKVMPAASASAPKLTKLAAFLGKSGMTTGTATAGSKGELPTLSDLTVGAAIDTALFGLGKLGGKIYKSAFKGTKGQERELVKQYGTTSGDIAEEFGYKGSAKGIETKVKNDLTGVWNKLKATAQKSGQIKPSQFDDIAKEIADKMTSELPNNAYKKQLVQDIMDSVSQFKPTKSISGDQVVALISDINDELFMNGQRIVLPSKVANSLTNKIKVGLKDLLPEEVKPLYTQYAKRKVIERVMQDAEIRRLVGRTLIGGSSGGMLGGLTAVAQGKTNPIDIAQDALIFGLIGGLGARASANTSILTNIGGNMKEIANNPYAVQLAKTAAQKVLNFIKGEKDF